MPAFGAILSEPNHDLALPARRLPTLAIYRFSADIIGRSKGYSATAAAAYRAGERIEDERTGTVHDYRRRSGVLHAEILAPAGAPAWVYDRAKLWNAVEQAERRRDAQLSRQLVLALPHELTDAQRKELVRAFLQREFVSRGMVADFVLHAPDRESDPRNHHAHVLLTLRRIEGEKFGNKERGWNDEGILRGWRYQWAQFQNRALERAGYKAGVDHRSYEDQGIDREPTQHLGKWAHRMEKAGKKSRIGEQNRHIQARNAERAKREHQFKVIHLEAEREKRRLLDVQRRAAQDEFTRAGAKPPPSAQVAFGDAARAPEHEVRRDAEPTPVREAFAEASQAPPDIEPVRVAEAFEQNGQNPQAENRETDTPEIWDRDAYEREQAEKLIDAAIAEAEQAERRAREEARRDRFEDWAARQRQTLFSRQLEDRDALYLAHERIRELWVNRIGESFDRRRAQTNAQIRAIEERQAQAGFKGWLYRMSGRAEAEREEMESLKECQHDLAREQKSSRQAMDAPLRAEDAALHERQDVELRELERQLAERWEQSWNRADRRTNDNQREREDDERGQGTSRERGDGAGRMRIRGYE
jgi:hypothetical protein